MSKKIAKKNNTKTEHVQYDEARVIRSARAVGAIIKRAEEKERKYGLQKHIEQISTC